MSKFNPYEHLTVSVNKEGVPIYEVLLDKGLPVTVTVGKKTGYKMVPKRYLNAVGYRRWYKSEYPEGVMEIEDITPDPHYDAVSKQIIAQKETKVKCTLYADRKRTEFLANSYGTSEKRKYNNEEFNPDYREADPSFSFAQASAIKNAMVNAGFILDTNEITELQKNLPTFVEDIILSEDCLGVSPLELEEEIQELSANQPMLDVVTDKVIAVNKEATKNVEEPSSDENTFTEKPVEKEYSEDEGENDFSKKLAKRVHGSKAQKSEQPKTEITEPVPEKEAELECQEKNEAEMNVQVIPENEEVISEPIMPESVVFKTSPECDNEKFKALEGKCVGDLSPQMIKAFSNERYKTLLSEETYNAIVAMV